MFGGVGVWAGLGDQLWCIGSRDVYFSQKEWLRKGEKHEEEDIWKQYVLNIIKSFPYAISLSVGDAGSGLDDDPSKNRTAAHVGRLSDALHLARN